jgi:hypothetical protein
MNEDSAHFPPVDPVKTGIAAVARAAARASFSMACWG